MSFLIDLIQQQLDYWTTVIFLAFIYESKDVCISDQKDFFQKVATEQAVVKSILQARFWNQPLGYYCT